MDLLIEPDIYEPTIDENGNYLPSSSKFNNGVRCSCGSRKEHVFHNRQSFRTHIKSQTHQKWIENLNANKMNYFSENIKLNENVSNQKLIIAKLQRENDEYAKLIVHLTKKIEMKENSNISISNIDLINFD